MNTKFLIKEDHIIEKELLKHIIDTKLPNVEKRLEILEPSPIRSIHSNPKTTQELLLHKVVGRFQFLSDCGSAYERDPYRQKQDEELERKLPLVIEEFKRMERRSAAERFRAEFEQRKQLLRSSYKIKKHKQNYHSLLDSIKCQTELSESEFSEEEQSDYSSMQNGRPRLLYPKYENVINYWTIPDENKKVKVLLGQNILCRQNPFIEASNHMKRFSLWKIKEIKKFFALIFVLPFDMDEVARQLEKKTYCCKVFFDMNSKPFELPQVMSEAKRKQQPELKKKFIKEFLKDVSNDLKEIFKGVFVDSEVREPNFPKDEIILSLEDYQRILNDFLQK